MDRKKYVQLFEVALFGSNRNKPPGTNLGTEGFAKLTELEELNLSGTYIKNISGLAVLKKLKVLNLSDTYVENSSALENLEILTLSNMKTILGKLSVLHLSAIYTPKAENRL